jgi:hypothetical protein
MKQKYLIAIVFLLLGIPALAQLKVSEDHRFLQTSSGKPFFWLGDTAWELFHKLSREEADVYLKNRAEKGFTVIQAVVLAELDGLNKPNAYGDKPLINNDPAKPNEVYFKHVDYIVKKAEKLGLIMAILPSWGDKWNKAWGVGPEIFSPENAAVFGEYLGKRYKNNAIVWVMGGDRDIMDQTDRDIMLSMVKGIKKGDEGKHLMTFHPQGGKSSSDFFKDDQWIDFHMSQTGHSKESKNYKFNIKNRALNPIKPHVDGEPRYEDHPNDFNPGEKGWMDDFDARQTAYWSLLSGAFGHTYGNHNIWQFFNGQNPVSWARTNWKIALDQPGSMQVGLMKKLFENYHWQRLVPDQNIIAKDNPETVEYEMAAVSQDGNFLMAYLPYGRKTTVNTGKLNAKKLKASLFNPRDGSSLDLGEFENSGKKTIAPPSEGRGSDWVLVIEQQI